MSLTLAHFQPRKAGGPKGSGKILTRPGIPTLVLRILPVDSRMGLASRTCCAFDDAVGHKEVF
ncbi:hypothetical protein QEV69_04670 [Trueperella pyogenes]|uniref:hypothetical protein n=1 Tax=Trueperella pyogenes TaxID=1661 RepID=UPI000AFACFB9|nr:hypothetical protein [Trueperella pyogenes]